MCFLRQCCTHSLCPTLWPLCPKAGSVLGHAVFVQKSWFDCGISLLHTKLGSHHVFFAAMLHSLFVPHIVATVPQSWLGLGHAAFVQKSWLDCGKSLLHTKLGLTMCFLRQCCTHSLCPSLWSQCSKTGSVLAMQFLCRSHGWTVVNHYYTQNWGLTMCFLRQCCTHSLCRTLCSQCSKIGSVLAIQFLCRSHDWTVVNHYYTQNWGLTVCFLRQCCTHSLCPSLWSQCSKTGSVLAMQPCARSHGWTVVNHYYTQTGVSPCFICGNAALTVCAPHCGHCAPKLARSWPCSPLCRSHGWTVVNHYCTQNSGLTMCILRQCCTHCLCPTLYGETPVLCVIMIYHSPIMTSAQKLYGQDRANFGAL